VIPAIYDDERRSLLQLSAALCCCSLLALPLTAAYSYAVSAHEGVVVATARYRIETGPMTYPAVPLARDPFRADPSPAVPAAPSGMAGMRIHQGEAIGLSLPPNAGAAEDAETAVPAFAVKAVVLGADPRALLDVGGSVRVVGIGDIVGTRVIRAIDESGLTLADGTKVPLSEQ